jgi:hypothetical protein
MLNHRPRNDRSGRTRGELHLDHKSTAEEPALLTRANAPIVDQNDSDFGMKQPWVV